MSEGNKNFMMVPNRLWEKLYEIRVPMQQRRVFDYIYRQTIGYSDNPREVSTYNIAKALRMKSPDVRDIIAELFDKKMVIRKGIYKEIQKDYTLWMVGEGSPSKKGGKVPLVGRGKKPSLVGEGSPLVKETLKDREKKGFLTKEDIERNEKRDKELLDKLSEAERKLYLESFPKH